VRGTRHLSERPSFNVTSENAFRPSPRDKGHTGEIPMSSTQVNITYITISISIPSELLKNIDQNIAGVTRNDKILRCVEMGYEILTNPKR
jgi:hypothetical protein